MKSFSLVVLLSSLSIVRGVAQVAATPSTAAPIQPTPAMTVSPSSVPASPVVATSQTVNNMAGSMEALSTALAILQTNVLETLPLLAFFNDNSELFANGVQMYVPPPGNMSVNLATNYAVNLGVNVAVSTGGSLFNAPVVKTPVRPAGSTIVPGLDSFPVNRDTLRALIILQSDMERLLPLLDTLNGGAGNSSGIFTNAFGFVRVNP